MSILTRIEANPTPLIVAAAVGGTLYYLHRTGTHPLDYLRGLHGPKIVATTSGQVTQVNTTPGTAYITEDNLSRSLAALHEQIGQEYANYYQSQAATYGTSYGGSQQYGQDNGDSASTDYYGKIARVQQDLAL